jgi:hypothetical protein
MPSYSMAVCNRRQRYIHYQALYVHQLYIRLLVDVFLIDMNLLTSNCILLPIIAVSSFTYVIQMFVQGIIAGGGNCGVAVAYLVSVLQWYQGQGRIG